MLSFDRLKTNSIRGRRINKSKIEKNLSKKTSIGSIVDEIRFELKTSRHRIQPEILQRIETLEKTVCQKNFALKRREIEPSTVTMMMKWI